MYKMERTVLKCSLGLILKNFYKKSWSRNKPLKSLIDADNDDDDYDDDDDEVLLTYGDVLYIDWRENSQSYFHTLQALDVNPTCDAADVR
jgi:hypothetical protein